MPTISLIMRKAPSSFLGPNQKEKKKWHDDVTKSSRSQLPVGSSKFAAPFPWTEVRSHTAAFLKSKHQSPAEQDSTLCKLISSHPNGIVGLAACARHLTLQTLQRILEGYVQSDGFENHEQYLQAFVAAAHDNYDKFALSDEDWARFLLSMIRSGRSRIPHLSNLRQLFKKWTKKLPLHTHLHEILVAVTRSLCKKLNTALDACVAAEKYDWVTAGHLSIAFVDLKDRQATSNAELGEILEVEIPSWRCWASWDPDHKRLEQWDSKALVWPLRPLWKLQGPNFDFEKQSHPAAWSRTISEGRLVHWLEGNSFTVGPGLLTMSAQEDFVTFMHALFSTADLVIKSSEVGRGFFAHLCQDPIGLDHHSLRLWGLANSTFIPKAPHFLSVLIGKPPKDFQPGCAATRMGLSILSLPSNKDLRIYLETPMLKFVQISISKLRTVFLDNLQTDPKWLPHAISLYEFYQTVADNKWLADSYFATSGVSQFKLSTMSNLRALSQLHRTLGHQLQTQPELRWCLLTYIANEVADRESTHEGASLIRELHLLYLVNDQTAREVGILMSAMKFLSVQTRTECIGDLKRMEQRHLRLLLECLSEKNFTGAGGACMTLACVVATVAHDSKTADAWRIFIRELLAKHGLSPEHFPDQPAFTACGFKSYREWIWNL